ncbi:hypothetical protein [Herbaspirillum huttiense]|uniref:Y-family DNA polymerase n=1 Tax=Herbaspirillum huttiense TaxID=863372 RepID=UPI0031D0770B
MLLKASARPCQAAEGTGAKQRTLSRLTPLSNNDGCAVARSNEAKALAYQHGIVALSSNYILYADMSHRVNSAQRRYSPRLEVYSIDESFLALDGLAAFLPSMYDMSQAIRQQVLDWLGMPICFGIGTTKTLANHIVRRQPRLAGEQDPPA